MKRPGPVNLVVRKYDPEWGSHIPILSRIMMVSSGPVLECGTGLYSTPLLHYFCKEQNRSLFSFENVKQWFDAHRNWRTEKHSIEFITDWDTLPIEKYHWGVVMIDHDADRRSIDAIRAARFADFVVLHDANGRYESIYHYEKVYPFFKYKYIYNHQPVHTVVVSNFIPVHTLWTI